MIKIAQFGEGNFLRAFADYYFDVLCSIGHEYSVSIIKPRECGNLDKFINQNCRYHVVLRGVEKGKTVEKVRRITVLNDAFSFVDKESFERLAVDADLKLVISNTTEAGIYFDERDALSDLRNTSYPAKLTAFLYTRFKSDCEGVYVLPLELIDDNASKLKECVERYIEHWQLPTEFADWNNCNNYYCNTLVDRIVSGYPAEEEERFEGMLGEKDELLTVGEPFGLWVVEEKGEIAKYLVNGEYGVNVVLTKDVSPYKNRKVRVLNGSHTNMVFPALWNGATTVCDVMNSYKLNKFVKDTLDEEIIPFVTGDTHETIAFAESVIERFNNPFINHKLLSISLNSVAKWRARVLPSFVDYYRHFKALPHNMLVGLSYLVFTYRSIYTRNGAHYFDVGGKALEIKDDEAFLEFFIRGGTTAGFLSADTWGVDLNEMDGLYEALCDNLNKLQNGNGLI